MQTGKLTTEHGELNKDTLERNFSPINQRDSFDPL